MKSMENLGISKISDDGYIWGIKRPIYPNKTQKRIINYNIVANRLVYNRLVEIQKKIGKVQHNDILSKEDKKEKIKSLKCLNSVKELRASIPMLNDKVVDSDNIAQTKKAYQAAWNNFKKVHKAGVPNYKEEKWFGSYRTTNHYSKGKKANMLTGSVRFINKHTIRLSKIGEVHIYPIPDKYWKKRTSICIGTTTISKDSKGQYWVSMQVGSQFNINNAQSNIDESKIIGIDLNTGVNKETYIKEDFCYDSEGNTQELPAFYLCSQDKLKKLQRTMSRRQLIAKKAKKNYKQSKNYRKARIAYAKKAERVANQRDSYMNEIIKYYTQKYDVIVLEDLSSKNMLKNHALAKSISDSGFRLFIMKMQAKCSLLGKKCIVVDPKNTTQICSACGYICGKENKDEHLALDKREWDCPNCGIHHIRDHNAAKNILQRGKNKLKEELDK